MPLMSRKTLKVLEAQNIIALLNDMTGESRQQQAKHAKMRYVKHTLERLELYRSVASHVARYLSATHGV
jgi:hypothetical protein